MTEKPTLSLADLEKQRIAVVFEIESSHVVVTGVGYSADDSHLGSVLRVELDDASDAAEKTTILIPEAALDRVRRESLRGCDFCITLA